MAATFGKDLIFNEEAAHARTFQQPNRSSDICNITKAGIPIGQDRDLDPFCQSAVRPNGFAPTRPPVDTMSTHPAGPVHGSYVHRVGHHPVNHPPSHPVQEANKPGKDVNKSGK